MKKHVYYLMQMLCGFAAWFVVLFVIVAFSEKMKHATDKDNHYLVAFVIFAFVGLAFLSYFLATLKKWRGFIPGVFLGIGLTLIVTLTFVLKACSDFEHIE